MAKKKKEKVSTVIIFSMEDNLLLKQYMINLESVGVYKTKSEVASELFSVGLHREYEMLSKN